MTSNSLTSLDGLSHKDKRTVILVAAGGAVWIGCCLAAYISWRRYYDRADSISNGSSLGIYSAKSQKSQFVVNELRKVSDDVASLRKDINGVKVLVKQLRRDIAELRCLDRNGGVMQVLTDENDNFHALESTPFINFDGYCEDDESDFEFRSAKSDSFEVRSRASLRKSNSALRLLTTEMASPQVRVSTSESNIRASILLRKSKSGETEPEIFANIDKQLDAADNVPKRETLKVLEEMYSKNKTNAEIKWRLGRALYYVSEVIKSEGSDTGQRRDMAYRAKDLCFEAMNELPEPSADVYKWAALTLGCLQDYESISNKIKQGYEFRTLIEKSIELDPDDSMSHYLLGRWFYGVYQLSWYERKIAATLFATPPTATIDEALGEFLKCSELLKKSGAEEWKENCLFIAKCYIEKRDTTGEAQRWLKCGQFLPDIDEEARLAGQEIEKLLNQYG